MAVAEASRHSANISTSGYIPDTRLLKYVCRFEYGESLADETRVEGPIPIMGSNGQFATHTAANTGAPVIIVGRKGSFGKLTWSDKPVFAIDTTFYVDASCTRADLRWLYYALQTLHLDSSSQDAAVPGLNREDAYSKRLVVPSPKQQRTIAAYLDRETARIDDMIAAKERLLDVLTEKRQALITQAVTRGLDPSVPLKDSGIHWFAKVPAHWRIAGMTKYLTSQVDYRGKTPDKADSGVFLVTARNVRNGVIDYSLSQEYITQEAYDTVMARGLPKIGDLLMTTEAPLGQVALVDREDVGLAQRIIKFRYDQTVLTQEYALYWFLSSSFQAQLWSYATGSTAEGIKGERLHLIQNVIPPITEQAAIVERIRGELSSLSEIRHTTVSSLTILKERRAALIAAAVTGQIEVDGGA